MVASIAIGTVPPISGSPRRPDMTARFFLSLFFALPGALTCFGEPTGRRDLRVHDPSTIVRAEGAWWLFGTGRLVLSARSPDLLKWEKLSPALKAPPSWAREITPNNERAYYWAPDIIRLGDRWALYYSVSEFGKNTSAIGLATSPVLNPADPAHKWTDRGIVMRSDAKDDFNAIDPSLLHDAEGRLWMAFGSFWAGLFLVELDPTTGLRRDPIAAPIQLAWSEEIEAPTLHRRGGYYYLFINEGRCCRGKSSTYRVLVGRSRAITGPYVDDQGRDLRERGGRLVLGSEGAFIGPGHATVVEDGDRQWLAVHFYDGTRNGAPTLALRRLAWTDDGWPRVTD
jgi:arabinan endo-1,5-alpha-L-arabinosidase